MAHALVICFAYISRCIYLHTHEFESISETTTAKSGVSRFICINSQLSSILGAINKCGEEGNAFQIDETCARAGLAQSTYGKQPAGRE